MGVQHCKRSGACTALPKALTLGTCVENHQVCVFQHLDPGSVRQDMQGLVDSGIHRLPYKELRRE